MEDNVQDAKQLIERGYFLSKKGQFAEAEELFSEAISINPSSAMAHNNLAWTRQTQGDIENAIIHYKEALKIDPTLSLARRNLIQVLVRNGRGKESIDLWKDELETGLDGLRWLDGLVSSAMFEKDLSIAGEYASLYSQLRWGGVKNSDNNMDAIVTLNEQEPHSFIVTIPKLQHDIDQLLYLQSKGIMSDVVPEIVNFYKDAINILENTEGNSLRIESLHNHPIYNYFNRILHIKETPKLLNTLSNAWDRKEVEDRYLNNPPGVVVIDDFLTQEALNNVRQFCLESTVWSINRYAHGRLGAFFQDGFTCPLLLQIAEELRTELPNIILDEFPLRQMWGFKYDKLPADSTTHADFAAVNVNFWITPDDANLDPTTGGLVIYDVGAPLDWNFDLYNRRDDVIKNYLDDQKSRAYTIPYKQNRAIIFNSDLFHATSAVDFKTDYENRRINVTMLYGVRERDILHGDTST